MSSAAGTDLTAHLVGAQLGAVWGGADKPGLVQHWPGGLCLAFPPAGSVNGTLVMSVGDVNLTFKRYLETPVTLRIENDYVVEIKGSGYQAELMRSYLEAFDEAVDAYARRVVGHSGLFVVADHPACTQSDFQTSLGQQIDRCQFFRQDNGMFVVVVPDERADPQM